ncbi:MAG: PKD domain-containing protein, partial [Cyclobacteriaceae bacterium]
MGIYSIQYVLRIVIAAFSLLIVCLPIHASSVPTNSFLLALEDFTLSDSIVNENDPVGTLVGIFESNETGVIYTLVEGVGSEDNDQFTIIQNGDDYQLLSAAIFNFALKSEYTVRVRATGSDEFFEKAFAITVNAAPVANAGEDQEVLDNNGDGQKRVNLDGSGSTDDRDIVRYVWTMPNNTVLADTTGADVRRQIPVGTYTITLTVYDERGLTSTDDVVITINEFEPPEITDITLDPNPTNIDENQANAVVGTFQTQGGQAPFTYTLTGSNNDNSFFIIDGDQLKTALALNYEELSFREIEVTVNSRFTQEFTIGVTNVEEPPTAINLSATTVTQDAEEGTIIGTFSVEGGATVPITYNLLDDANQAFSIDGDALKVGNNFDEDISEYNIEVQAEGDGIFEADFTITVIPANIPPEADAGSDQTIEDSDRDGSETVSLDGSGASDTDGSIASYAWSWPGGGSASGESPEVALPVGETIITLTVTDEDGETDTDEVKVTVNEKPNQAPTANAGADQTLTDEDGNGTEAVTLDGSGSSDDIGITDYIWIENNAIIANGTNPSVELTVGEHIIELTVTDEQGESDTDEVQITINARPNQAPVANAGPDQLVTDGNGDGTELVTLDGSGSSDTDGTIDSYVWNWNGGSTSGENPQITLPVGQTVITLTVTDNQGETDTDEVEITVNEPANQPPVADAGSDQTIVDNDRDGVEEVELNG